MSVTSRTPRASGTTPASRGTTPGPRPALPGQASEVEVEVEVELRRLVDRWRRLPLDQALSYSGRVRALVQSLADRVAEASGIPVAEVPDLGPATLMDQLTVLVHDTSKVPAAAKSVKEPPPHLAQHLAQDLATLRRNLPGSFP